MAIMLSRLQISSVGAAADGGSSNLRQGAPIEDPQPSPACVCGRRHMVFTHVVLMVLLVLLLPSALTAQVPFPNLTPLQPTGWGDKIVVSKVAGTNTDGSGFLTSDQLYIDWSVINNGIGPYCCGLLHYSLCRQCRHYILVYKSSAESELRHLGVRLLARHAQCGDPHY